MSDFTTCPGCGLQLATVADAASSRTNASAECQRLCHELSYYTLSHGDPFFIHQVVVDSYAAQHAGPNSKPIGVAFALIGLCLLLEHGYTGKEVQETHMRLAKQTKEWPLFTAPVHRGGITVDGVLNALPGEQRDKAIKQWAASVWDAWNDSHQAVRALIERYERKP